MPCSGPLLDELQSRAAGTEMVEGGVWAAQHSRDMDPALAEKRHELIQANLADLRIKSFSLLWKVCNY